MNDLEIYFKNNKGWLIHKQHHYFDIYDRHFSRFRCKKDLVIVEIGVYHGGSLQMWKNYFGDKAKIYGIDIDPRCKKFEEKGITIFIGSQSDRNFLNKIKLNIPKIDILIDDGGHTMKQQKITFEELFNHIKDDGIYLCEDCHTSYWNNFGGGYKRRGTFIEYSKNWIDFLNAFNSRSKHLKVNNFTLHAKSVHYYGSVVVVEKSKMSWPITSKTGEPSYNEEFIALTFNQKLIKYIKRIINKFFEILNTSFYIE